MLLIARHHPFDVIVGSTIGMLFAWMAYRQYFPALSVAEGGRPYSIAEFATEKYERPVAAFATAATREADLELGRTRQRPRKPYDVPGPVAWDGMDTDMEEGVNPVRQAKGQHHEDDYERGSGQSGFEENTEYRSNVG
jgi:hypothetical protein